MKLRIRGNSIRLRLTQPEVAALASGGEVRESTRFPDGGVFEYRLVADGAASEPGATFADGVLTVKLPTAAAGRWARETIVSLEYAAKLRDGSELRLLVEKDFECLTPRGESDEGAFPNPAKQPGCDGAGGA
jgi:hypothetical protein